MLDLFDGVSTIFFGARGGLARQVEGGDLEAVEQEAGAARVDLVGGNAAEDFTDGELDGGTVLGQGELEGGFTVVDGG